MLISILVLGTSIANLESNYAHAEENYDMPP